MREVKEKRQKKKGKVTKNKIFRREFLRNEKRIHLEFLCSRGTLLIWLRVTVQNF